MHRLESLCVATYHSGANAYKFSHFPLIAISTYYKGQTMPRKMGFHAKLAWQTPERPPTRSYELSESCKLVLQAGDITKWSIDGQTDAIVNAANTRMLGGGGVDGAIHRAAGKELLRACQAVPEVEPDVRCPTGSARITKAFKLPVSHVIHTVGPIYKSEEDPASALSSAYKNSVMVAKENHIKYVAFPAISCGIYRYPVEEAAQVALSTLQNHAADLKAVHFVLFGPAAWKAWLEEADRLFKKQEE